MQTTLMTNTAPQMPYRCLANLQENDPHLFWGRDNELAQLIVKLRTSSPVVLLGESGVGKTSLLCAGLAPRLRELGCQVVYAQCADLAKIFDTALEAQVLLLDHGEQILCGGQGLEPFARALTALCNTPHGKQILLALRQEAAFGLLDLEIPALYDYNHTVRLLRMGRESAQVALAGPTACSAYPLPAEVVQACLDDLEGQDCFAGYLPTDLAILGHELFERAKFNYRPVTLTDYRLAGGAQILISQFYTALVDN